MQLQGLLLILIMLIVIPLVILFANHTVFFIIMSFVLLVNSLKTIHSVIFKVDFDFSDLDDELSEDLEDMMNVNMKKFGTGIEVMKNLIIIMFYAYCTFYVHSFAFKAVAAAIILYWTYALLRCIKPDEKRPQHPRFSMSMIELGISALSILFIVIVVCNKLIRIVI